MKKLISITLLLLFSFTSYSQKDVTRFLGIPVDGSNAEMVRKLKLKGFKSDVTGQYLKGQFNGKDVNLHVVTNNNKVYRIMLCDAFPMDESNIKIRFNTLCQQFENNSNYISFDNYRLSEEEDIFYELTVNKKRYQAVFFQIPTGMDSTAIRKKLHSFLSTKFTEEQLSNPTIETKSEIDKVASDFLYDFFSKRPVWFLISQELSGYSITMYYDNEFNKANGEDL